MPKSSKKSVSTKKITSKKVSSRRREKESSSQSTTEDSVSSRTEDSTVSGSYQDDTSSSQSSAESSYSESGSYKSKKMSSRSKKAENEKKIMTSEANVHWESVEFIGSMKMEKSKLLNSKGELKENGVLNFNLHDGTLKYGERSNAPDFAPLNSKKKASGSSGNHDIVKSIEMTAFSLKGYDEKYLIEVNVPKFQSEGFYNESETVNKIILPNELDSSKGENIQILSRKITNSVILFQNQFPGINPETYQKHIQKCDENFSLVNLNSPIIGIYNADPRNQGKKILRPQKGFEKTNQVMMKNRVVLKYEEKSTEAMKNKISYANITGGFEVKLSAVIPHHRLAEHKKWVSTSGAQGKQFLAWAEGINTSSKSKNLDSNMNEKPTTDCSDCIDVQFKCIVKYIKITDKPVEINI